MKIKRIFGLFDSPIRTRTSGCVYDISGIAPTLNTMQGGYREPIILDEKTNKLRRLTSLECERLMGWKEDWTKYGINDLNEQFEVSEKKRLKMCGNGITSDVPKTILETILPQDKEYKVFSTFSGVDGSCQKLNNNFKIVGFSEFDPDDKSQMASKVLKFHYPTIPNFSDVTKLDYNLIPDFDILFTSSPCQDFSAFGKRQGIEGLKGQLIYSIFKLTEAKQPSIVIFENVKGLLTIANGDSFKLILEEFSKLGYSVDFELCNSKNFGLAQSRDRVFLICYKNIELNKLESNSLSPISNKTILKIKKEIKTNELINYSDIGIPLLNNNPPKVIKDILLENPPNKSFIPEKYNELFFNKKKN
jgi:DNA-cytosine methyltransferase